jgi:hypothetical protein
MTRFGITGVLGLGLMLAHAPALAAAPDWDSIEGEEITLFYPGVAAIEWILGEIRIGQERHQGARVFKMGDRCIECHAEELADMGEEIVLGVDSGKDLEPTPIPGKAGVIELSAQAAYDDDTLYLRFSWKQPPASGAEPMDADNPMKIAFMLDADKVELADQSGCWASCHADARTMPGADDARTKYVSGGSLADGVFYDLHQWRAGEDKAFDGYVADARVMEGGAALKGASGQQDGDTWTVVFERSLAGGEGDVTLESGGVYNIGVAIHDDHAAGRFHHVSMGLRLGLGADADIVATRL